MHNFIRIATLTVMITGAAASAGAATPNEFYTSLLRRGITSHDAGRYVEASKQLRIAAFGLVEAVDQYELAQVYLALTYDKLQEPDRAREAARRVVAAERIERKYGTLSLPSTVRSSFDAIANRLLAPGDLGILRGTAVSTPPSRTTTTPSRATTTAPQTTTPPATTPARTQPQPTQPPPASTPAQQSTTRENTAPQTITPQPKPVPPPATAAPAKPPAATTTPAVKPPQTTTPTTQTATNTTPSTAKPPQTATTKPATQPPPPATTKPAPASTPKPLTASEVAARVAAAERALNAANLDEARRLYRELLAVPTLEHDTLIRVAEGLYRSRDFENALAAFSRVGTLRRGEEPYRYYIAVALYETGDYTRAKKELAAALPYIEVTPDVARYRTKIEGSM